MQHFVGNSAVVRFTGKTQPMCEVKRIKICKPHTIKCRVFLVMRHFEICGKMNVAKSRLFSNYWEQQWLWPDMNPSNDIINICKLVILDMNSICQWLKTSIWYHSCVAISEGLSRSFSKEMLHKFALWLCLSEVLGFSSCWISASWIC